MDSAATTDRISRLSCLPKIFPDVLEAPILAVSAIAGGVAAVIYALLGPMGMEDELDVLRRLAFVGSTCALCWPLCHATSAAILYATRNRPPMQIVVAATAGTAFMAVPSSAVAITLYGAFAPDVPLQDDLPEVYLNVLLLLAGCSAFVHYAACQRVTLREARAGGQTAPGASSVSAPRVPGNLSREPRERFFARLPAKIGQDVIYLSVSGHYLSVVTTEGSSLILMRLADAVAALGDLGLQVHRSHWVAHQHILATIRRDDRTMIRVTGPLDLPVSRTYLANVRDAVPRAQEQRARPPDETPE